MAMQGSTDTLISQPKFPKERTLKGEVTLSLAVTATLPNAILRFVGTGSTTANVFMNVANNWVANTANMGNTAGLQGWNETGPYVVNVCGNTIFLSQAPHLTLVAGEKVTFSQPITYKANTSATLYSANTYLVSATRQSNANSILQSGLFNTSTLGQSTISHPGWVHLEPQTGYVKAVTISAAGSSYANGYATVTANTQYPGGSGANVGYTVDSSGAIVSATVLNPGVGYFLTPTIALPANTVNTHYRIATINPNNRGNNYVNGALTIATTTTGSGAQATCNIFTGNGSIKNIILVSGGGGYDGNTGNLTITGANGTAATFTVTEALGGVGALTLTMGGRANRVLTEVLSVVANADVLSATSGGIFFPGL